MSTEQQCPHCGAPPTNEGQPSKRQFYGCGSFGYPNGNGDRTELCMVKEELAAVTAERDEAKRLRFAADAGRRQERHQLTKERDTAIAERDALRAAARAILNQPTDTDGTLSMRMRLIAKEALSKTPQANQ
jgi:hypothetical protein